MNSGAGHSWVSGFEARRWVHESPEGHIWREVVHFGLPVRPSPVHRHPDCVSARELAVSGLVDSLVGNSDRPVVVKKVPNIHPNSR